jgi:autotransporter-associated beta strand protein
MTIQPGITGAFSLTKVGTGTVTLTGANAYTGGTTISAGTLALGASNVLPGTVAIGSATLNAATFTDTVDTLDVTGSAVINLGSGAALSFANSSAIDWSGGTLTITGTFVSGSSLRFGTNASGLTPAQLAVIRAPGVSFVALNASGYLIASAGASYSHWHAATGTTGSFNADHDNDGVLNGIEYFLGGNTNTTGYTPLPGIISTNGILRITWTKSATYPGIYGTNFWVETTDTLDGSWTAEPLGGNVSIAGNNITYTFPAGAQRFARLKVSGP